MQKVFTPKEKADDLIDKFLDYSWADLELKGEEYAKSLRDNAKRCALIIAEEMLDNEPGIRHILVMEDSEVEYEWVEYWQNVKREIKKHGTDNRNQKIAEAIGQSIVNMLANEKPAEEVPVSGRPIKKYAMGERVKVCGWVGSDFGTIDGIDWIYHSRSNEYVWGYHILYEGEGAGLSLNFVPEGYLRKENE